MSKQNNSQKPPFGPQVFEKLARQVMEKSLAKRGFTSAELITRWNDIVGSEIAERTEPKELKLNRAKQASGATLVVKVDRSALLEAPMWAPLIVERVNGYLGLGTVANIKFSPDTVYAPEIKPAPPVFEPAKTLDEALDKLAQSAKNQLEN